MVQVVKNSFYIGFDSEVTLGVAKTFPLSKILNSPLKTSA